MATRINQSQVQPLRSRRVYPWEEWTDGSWWEIRQGVDFTISVAAMRSTLQIKARSDGPWRVEVRFPEDGPSSGRTRIQFRFVPREESAP